MQRPQPIPAPRRGRGPLFWIAVFGGIGMLACVGICVSLGGLAAIAGSRPTATPVIARMTNGSATVSTDHWGLTVTGTETTKTLVWTSVGNKQEAVGQWLLVNATLVNTGKENFGVNTWDFEIVDGAGNVYKHSTEGAALLYPESKQAKSASSQQIPPGVTTPLILVFDVNPAATGLQLVLKQGNTPRIDLAR